MASLSSASRIACLETHKIILPRFNSAGSGVLEHVCGISRSRTGSPGGQKQYRRAASCVSSFSGGRWQVEWYQQVLGTLYYRGKRGIMEREEPGMPGRKTWLHFTPPHPSTFPAATSDLCLSLVSYLWYCQLIYHIFFWLKGIQACQARPWSWTMRAEDAEVFHFFSPSYTAATCGRVGYHCREPSSLGRDPLGTFGLADQTP